MSICGPSHIDPGLGYFLEPFPGGLLSSPLEEQPQKTSSFAHYILEKKKGNASFGNTVGFCVVIYILKIMKTGVEIVFEKHLEYQKIRIILKKDLESF